MEANPFLRAAVLMTALMLPIGLQGDDLPSAWKEGRFLWDSSGPFLGKLAGDGSRLRYAFRVGGNDREEIHAVTADAQGNAYVVGHTASMDFPLTNALQAFKPVGSINGFVMKVAPMGDLVESMFKRNLDTKDFGSIVKGHGGVLDRFDGFLFTLPAVYYLTMVLEPWNVVRAG